VRGPTEYGDSYPQDARQNIEIIQGDARGKMSVMFTVLRPSEY